MRMKASHCHFGWLVIMTSRQLREDSRNVVVYNNAYVDSVGN